MARDATPKRDRYGRKSKNKGGFSKNWLGNLEPDGLLQNPFTFNLLLNVASTIWGSLWGCQQLGCSKEIASRQRGSGHLFHEGIQPDSALSYPFRPSFRQPSIIGVVLPPPSGVFLDAAMDTVRRIRSSARSSNRP